MDITLNNLRIGRLVTFTAVMNTTSLLGKFSVGTVTIKRHGNTTILIGKQIC
jgi:hypothetical protein